jgi:2-desacetyl-2-hydroxyethyl bacteriochlorophyllide A dehydrogenase
MLSELLLAGPREIQLSPYEELPLEPDQIRAEAILSGISHGTELALYRGNSPFAAKSFDRELRLFVDDADTGAYPMRLGYEWVGTVREVGGDVHAPAVGDLVHLALPHRETQTLAPESRSAAPWSVLPSGLDPERAALLQSVAISLQAVHDGRLKVGDAVAVFGLGSLGLLAVQLARLNGAGWIAGVDPVEGRRELARRFGADLLLDPDSCDAGREITLAAGTGGADLAIEFSGRYAALHQALRSVRVAGTVVAAGFYVGSGDSDLRLGEEFHHNRLTLVGSMSGWNVPHRAPGWDRPRLRTTALELLAQGRLDVEPFVTHRVPFARAADAYELIDRRPEETLRVVLTY